MALTFTTGMTAIDSAESVTNWALVRWSGSGQFPSIQLDNGVFREGAGSVAGKVAGNNWVAGNAYDYYTANANTALNMSTAGNEVLAMWVQIGTPAAHLARSAGGVFIWVQSSAETGVTAPTIWNEWWVSGADVYPGGWVLFMVDTRKARSGGSGTVANLASIRRMGIGVRNVASVPFTIKAENVFSDKLWYGRPNYKVTGDGTLVAAWKSFFDAAVVAQNGLIEEVAGSYLSSCGFQIGTDAQGATTTFLDATARSVVFKRHTYHNGTSVVDGLNYADYYSVSAKGAASFNTSVTFGSVVGTGDDRQGVLGGSIKSESPANMTWLLDFQTDIAHLSAAKVYGVDMIGAGGGLFFDGKATAANSSVISCAAINCGEIDTGANNDGVELLNAAIIDPKGTTNNYGLKFSQVPVGSVLNHRVKNVSLITSGVPTTQYMINFAYAGDYSIDFTNVQRFGDYSSGTLWHGINSGNLADITISNLGSSNMVQAEFSNTSSGTVTVVNSPLLLKVYVQDKKLLTPILNVQTSIFLLNSPFTQLMNEDTLASGVAEETYTGSFPVAVVIKARKSETTDNPRYFPESQIATITAAGLDATMSLKQNTFLN